MPFALPYSLPTYLPGPVPDSANTTSDLGGAAGTLHELTSHCASARALILAQYKDSPHLLALLCSYVDRIQELETGIVAVYERAIDIENAEGDQLDLIGRIVREARDGRSDWQYRNGLRVRVLINRSQGRLEDLIAIVRLFEVMDDDPAAYVRIREPQPMRVTVHVAAAPSLNAPSEIHRRMLRAKAAGVALQTITHPTPAPSVSRIFALGAGAASVDKANVTTGLGWTGDTRGGHLGHVLA